MLSTFSFSNSIFAQLPSGSGGLNENKKWQVGVNINTVEPITEAGYDIYFGQIRLFNDFDHQKSNLTSLGFNVSYKVQESWGIRLSAKALRYKVEETYNQKDYVDGGTPSGDYIIDTGSVKQSAYSFAPGVFWNIPYKKNNFYGGFQVVYKKFDPAFEHLIYRRYSTQTDTLTSYRYYDFKIQGGLAIGIAPFVGFSANIYKGFSLGAEFSSAYSYYKTGGALTETETRIYPIQSSGGYTNKHTYQASKFSSVISSINLSYSF